MTDKRYWSAKEAADYLSVSVQTLYQWMKAHSELKTEYDKLSKPSKLIGPPPPYRRFGRNCVRFPVDEFIKWSEPQKDKQNA